MLNSKIPLILFSQVRFFTFVWILHKLYTIITLIKWPDGRFLMFSITYNVVCVPNYSVPLHSLTPTYLEGAGLIPLLKMILIYCVKCQRQAECWFIFLFLAWHLYSCKKSKNNPDIFCYICGNVVLPKHQAKITDFVKKAYFDYFGVKLGDQDKPFAPCICFKTCVENLRDWRNSKKKSMPLPFQWSGGKEKISLWTAISSW